jgi:probable addiction module antidote protein
LVSALDAREPTAENMNAVLEANKPQLFPFAAAQANSMAQVAKGTGLGGESLYKAPRPGALPCFATVMKVTPALGVKFTVHPT